MFVVQVTKNAVVCCEKNQRKASIRHESMLPKVAIIDPVLTVSCPRDLTANTGMDALCQVIEPYVSNSRNPIVDSFCVEGIIRISRSIRSSVSDGSNLLAREDMAVGSMLSGLSLANSKLGIVHGIASVLGGGINDTAPSHGALCATLLPHVFIKNIEKIGNC